MQEAPIPEPAKELPQGSSPSIINESDPNPHGSKVKTSFTCGVQKTIIIMVAPIRLQTNPGSLLFS